MSNEEAHKIYTMVGLRTGCCQITELVEKYEQLQQENKELKQRFYNAIHEIQLIQMDGEVSVRDITKLVGTLKGDK